MLQDPQANYYHGGSSDGISKGWDERIRMERAHFLRNEVGQLQQVLPANANKVYCTSNKQEQELRLNWVPL